MLYFEGYSISTVHFGDHLFCVVTPRQRWRVTYYTVSDTKSKSYHSIITPHTHTLDSIKSERHSQTPPCFRITIPFFYFQRSVQVSCLGPNTSSDTPWWICKQSLCSQQFTRLRSLTCCTRHSSRQSEHHFLTGQEIEEAGLAGLNSNSMVQHTLLTTSWQLSIRKLVDPISNCTYGFHFQQRSWLISIPQVRI